MPNATQRWQVTASSLNVREAPSITARAIGFLARGEIVDHRSTSGDGYWIRIRRSDGLEGWASHKYLVSTASDADIRDEELPWMPIAIREIGVKAFPGNGDNPRIVEYLQSTTLEPPLASNDETFWCSAFANWCMERAGFEGTDSAWARSWLNWGKAISRPKRGCVTVFRRGSGGHVGFFIRQTATTVIVLGGNQSEAVKVSSYAKSSLLGYRMPGA